MAEKQSITKGDNMGKEVATKEEYAIVKSDITSFNETLKMNLGDEGLSIFSLERIRVPSGGSRTWTIPGPTGEIETQDLKGIIIYTKMVRQYYEDAFEGGGKPPECFSNDNRTGMGNPGGDCNSCPLSKFGSGNDGKTACKQRRLLFILLNHSMLPILLSVPPSALKEAKSYFMKLAGMSKPYFSVITKFDLKKEKSSTGIDYSKMSFQYVEDAPSAGTLYEYHKAFGEVVSEMPLQPIVE